METPIHTINSLFEQLGLDGTDSGINEFIEKHGELKNDVELHEASFWTPSQAALLLEMKENDADWAELVDQLDSRLR